MSNLLFGLLGAWLLLSITYQFPGSVRERLGRCDPLGLLPTWSFFAPNPGTSDYRLAIRDLLLNEEWTEWQEVQFYTETRLPRFLWNPGKVELKALSDLTQILLQSAREGPADWAKAVLLTWPYIALLRRAIAESRKPNAIARQFGLLASAGHRPPRSVKPLFISAVHRFK